MKKHLNIIMNGKGGVGKSTFATQFVQYLKDRQIPHRAIDTDNENSTLKRFHQEAAFVNIDDPQSMDEVFSSLEQNNLVVLDCRAASTDLLLDYFQEIHAFEVLKALKATATIIIPVNHEADSVEQIKIITDSFAGQCRYLIVKNQVHSEHFKIYENSQIRHRVLHEFGGTEMVMPKLYDWLVTLLNEDNLTITDAIRHPKVSLMDRQRLKNWQNHFNERIDRVKSVLLASGAPKKSSPAKADAGMVSQG